MSGEERRKAQGAGGGLLFFNRSSGQGRMFCASGGQAKGSDEDPRAGGREHLGVGEELGLPEAVEPGSEGWYAGCPRSTDGPAPSQLCIKNRHEGSNQCIKSFSSWSLASKDIGVGCISPSVTL